MATEHQQEIINRYLDDVISDLKPVYKRSLKGNLQYSHQMGRVMIDHKKAFESVKNLSETPRLKRFCRYLRNS